MGQGLYNMLGLGLLDPPWPDDDEAREALFEDLSDLGMSRDNECREEFLVVRMAVDDGCLRKWWKLAPLPDDVPRCAARRARYADGVAFEVPESAREAWARARELYTRAGLALPEPRLVVLNDYD